MKIQLPFSLSDPALRRLRTFVICRRVAAQLALGAVITSMAAAQDDYRDRRIDRVALQRVKDATVFIESIYRPQGVIGESAVEDRFRSAAGSGFVVHESGLIITNAHVVDAVHSREGTGATLALRAASAATYLLDRVTVRVKSGTTQSRVYDAQVLATYPAPQDLALLRIVPVEPLTAMPTHDPSSRTNRSLYPEELHRVWAVGFPLGAEMENTLTQLKMSKNPHGPDISVREGIVQAVRHDAEGHPKAIEHGAKIEHGNSGGPLVDPYGYWVGVNTFGIGNTDFAIPAMVVLNTFFQVLAWHGEGTLLQRASHDLHIVDPNSPRNAAARHWPTLPEALAAARNGDSIQLAEGDFPLAQRLDLRSGVRVRGAGIGRTILRAVGPAGNGWDGYAVRLGDKLWVELSDLTIINERGSGLGIVQQGSRDILVHDVEVRAAHYALGAHNAASPVVTRCRLEGSVSVDTKSAPRLDRCDIRASDLLDAIVIDDANPSFTACRVFSKVRIGNRGRASLRGCEIGLVRAHSEGVSWVAAVLADAGSTAEIEHCWFWVPNVPAIELRGGATATMRSSRVAGEFNSAVVLNGAKSRVELKENVFMLDHAPVRVGDAASAKVEGNVFLPAPELLRTLWPGAPEWQPPTSARRLGVALPKGADIAGREARRLAAERKARERQPVGILVHHGGTVTYSQNLFRAPRGGTALVVESGGVARDDGGNDTSGVTHARDTRSPAGLP